MAAVYNPENNQITMAIGDTYTFKVKVSGGVFADGDIALVAISTADGKDIVCKIFIIEGGKCTVRLNSADTADKEAGIYTWNVRLLHGATIENGKVEIDDAAEVMTIWNKAPKFVLVDGGCDV